MAADPVVRQSVAVADPSSPLHVLKPNADGSLNVSATGATFESSATATAAVPTYTEGQVAALSQTLAGALRVQTRGVPSSTIVATQVTVPATANGILVLAANAARLGAILSNNGTATVFVSSASTGLTTSNGFAVPAGASLNIDSPLYTGALYGIVATATQPMTTLELT